ncbi:Hypothetical protein PMN2A_1906 [Prochlorococcus marinus str. NATL2A]|uniref:Uncharacterized protein n=1 Tax=Prochlorococcus marinus (strain NATL2A) TaxID=59920 RepID=A7MDA6_PROMT|nr:Hypothetical protein PMN2A_1906 [Prochlorococcus marinus str. NATL2A]
MGSGHPYYPIDPWSLEGLLFNCSCISSTINFFNTSIHNNKTRKNEMDKEYKLSIHKSRNSN